MEDGDLDLLLAKNDAFNDNGDIFKTGRAKISLSPNPFAKGKPFKQVLDLTTGSIRIEADGIAIRVWTDANRPVYHVEIESPQEVAVTMTTIPGSGSTAAESGSAGSLQRMVQCYQAAADFADQMVGRLLDKLDETGRADNTIIVLWSDHGYHLGEKECCVKFTLWEKANCVPFIIVAPGVTRPGSRCDRPVGLVDIYPTLLEMASLPGKADLDGLSLVPLLKEPQRPWERPALMTEGPGNHAVRSDRWRYIRYSDGAEELYDHENDPWELSNLATNPEFAEPLAALRKWLPKSEAPGKGMDHLYRPVPPAGAGLPGSGYSRPRNAAGGKYEGKTRKESHRPKKD